MSLICVFALSELLPTTAWAPPTRRDLEEAPAEIMVTNATVQARLARAKQKYKDEDEYCSCHVGEWTVKAANAQAKYDEWEGRRKTADRVGTAVGAGGAMIDDLGDQLGQDDPENFVWKVGAKLFATATKQIARIIGSDAGSEPKTSVRESSPQHYDWCSKASVGARKAGKNKTQKEKPKKQSPKRHI